MIEVVGGPLAVAQVVGGDCEDVLAELKFQRGAGGGDIDAGLGQISLGVDLTLAGAGELGFQRGELGEQLGTEFGRMLGGGGDEPVEQAGDLAEASSVVFAEAERDS